MCGYPHGCAGDPVCGRMGVWVSGCLFFCSYLFASACLPACLGCLPALGGVLSWVPAGLGYLPALGARLPVGCLPACIVCRPAFLAWVPARFACLGARATLNFSTTRGTVPLTLVTAQHDRIPSQTCGHFLVSKAPQVGRSGMAGARQAQGRVGLRVAPIGLEFCGRSLRHRQVHEHQVRMGPTWTPSEMIPHFLNFLALARRQRLQCEP